MCLLVLLKLLLLGKKLNFLNILFVIVLAVELLCGYFYISNFIEIGEKSFAPEEQKPENLMSACGNW